MIRLSFLLLIVLVLWGACPELADAAQAPSRRPRREDPFARFRDLEPEPAPLVAAEPAWRLTLLVQPSAGGAMDDTRIYIPLREDQLVAIERETGLLAWIRDIHSSSPPVVANGKVFVVSGNAIRAVDAETGDDLWETPLDKGATARLVWDTGWLIAVVEPADVVALRAADGTIIWRQPLGAPSSHPAVPGGENALFFSLEDGRVVALALADGARLWEQKLSGTLSEPAVAKDRVFIGSTDNSFTAFDAESGAVRWTWRGGGDVIGAGVDGDVVYFVSLDNLIRAVNRGNGNQRWRKPTTTRPVLPPRAFGGIVVVPGLMPSMTVFNGKTGAVLGSHATPGQLIGPPLIDPVLKPFRVTFVTITREGVVDAMRSSALKFVEPPIVGLPGLPGRSVARERIDK